MYHGQPLGPVGVANADDGDGCLEGSLLVLHNGIGLMVIGLC